MGIKKSLYDFSIKCFILDLLGDIDTAYEKLAQLPTDLKLDSLKAMCGDPRYVSLQTRCLAEPRYIISILNRDRYYPEHLRTHKTIELFQWLETQNTDVTTELRKNAIAKINNTAAQDLPKLCESYLLLVEFLVDKGFFKDAIEILEAMPDSVKECQALRMERLMLLVLAFSLPNDRRRRISALNEELRSNVDVKPNLLAKCMYALSVAHFELFEFEQSYNSGYRALHALIDGTCDMRTIVNIYRHMVKPCLGLGKFAQAKLVIKQAERRALHAFGSTSEMYAKTLEDYSLYLFATREVQESRRILDKARETLLDVYGSRQSEIEISQGNISTFLLIDNNPQPSWIREMMDKNPLGEHIPEWKRRLIRATLILFLLLRTFDRQEMHSYVHDPDEMVEIMDHGKVLSTLQPMKDDEITRINSLAKLFEDMQYKD